jgi:hypothetical protein
MGTAVPCPVHRAFYPESGFLGVLGGWSPSPLSGDQEVTVGGTATLSGARLRRVRCPRINQQLCSNSSIWLGGYKYR